MSQQGFIREVLGDGVPPKVAEVIIMICLLFSWEDVCMREYTYILIVVTMPFSIQLRNSPFPAGDS